MAAMTGDGTVEWGEERPTNWVDRLLGQPDEVGRRRISGPALGCAVVAAALVLAAQLTPWMIISRVGPGGDGSPITGDEIHLDAISDFTLLGYYFGWLVLLGLVGLALVVEPGVRRPVVAGGLGWAVALFMIVVGLTRRVFTGGSPYSINAPETTSGPGLFFGVAAVILAAAALALAGWQPGTAGGGRPRPAVEPDVDEGPADLTVTPLQ